MSTSTRRRLTASERDLRRQHELERLRQATATLVKSDGWCRWLRARSRFHRYSLRNTLLIAHQCPHATHVAGFRQWLTLGRAVRKGEKAIRIFAPIRYPQPEPEHADHDRGERELVGFRLAAVFDVSQTEPIPGVEPAPLDPPHQPLNGDSHLHLLPALEQHARSLGFTVHYDQLSGADGTCSTKDARITIETALPGNGKVATLIHELAHAHGVDYRSYSRAEAELIVESVAFIVCSGAGLDTSSESIPYLASWNPSDAVEQIKKLTAKIDEIARAIEHTLSYAETADRPGTAAEPARPAPVANTDITRP